MIWFELLQSIVMSYQFTIYSIVLMMNMMFYRFYREFVYLTALQVVIDKMEQMETSSQKLKRYIEDVKEKIGNS